jgi:hypothetical protein
MNTLIETRFREVKVRLIYSPVVDFFKIIAEEIGKRKGHIRIKAKLKKWRIARII